MLGVNLGLGHHNKQLHDNLMEYGLWFALIELNFGDQRFTNVNLAYYRGQGGQKAAAEPAGAGGGAGQP